MSQTSRLSPQEQEERDIAEAIKLSLSLVEPEGYSFKDVQETAQKKVPTFAERLPLARICVIGANYAESDNERWSQVDPYYIGIEGLRYEPDLIPDNPIESFDWNSDPGSISMLFKQGPLKGKKFESIIIDRGTFHHIRNNMVFFSFFRVQQKSKTGPFADEIYLEEEVINKIPEIKEKIQKLEKNIASATDKIGIEFLEKKKDGLEGLLKYEQYRMNIIWQFLDPEKVDTIEVSARNGILNRFYGYRFKK